MVCRPFGHIGVRGSMKAIAPHSFFPVEFKGNSIQECPPGNSLMKGSIEYGNLGCPGKN